ncbi:winged helix-turn-helix transcriptional regulator [Caulobacter sp. KR2-114]|jgi:DNA-binding HxlR family transcriptional regulator|uniref:winged helix-turn-helix transcriptional regulator n=1 Tax=Caulobacter sp. KR2-114 TaxID=3400912 RepID=UPI003C11285F
MRWDEVADLQCSVARSLAILGDRWTMMLIREAFLGTRRFDEMQVLSGASPQVVATRLSRLVEAGILRKIAYQQRPTRYEYRLTEMGRELHPVMVALMTWGDKWLDDGQGPPNPLRHATCGAITRPKMICDQCGEPVSVNDLVSEPSERMARQRHEMLAAAKSSS